MRKGENSKSAASAAPAAFPVPADAAAANDFIRDIGVHRRQRERIEAAMNDELAKVRARYETDARGHSEKADQLERGLRTWCEAHRGDLTEAGKTKTHKFAAGEISWKKRPASVLLENAKDVLAYILDNGPKRFIRVRREVDKQAMLADPDRAVEIPGVKIDDSGEDFIVKPFGAALEQPLQSASA